MNWELLSQIASIGSFIVSIIALFVSGGILRNVKILRISDNTITDTEVNNSTITQRKN